VNNHRPDIVKKIYENRNESEFNYINYICQEGYLELLILMNELSNKWFSYENIDYAAKNGHLDIIEWLHKVKKAGCTMNAKNYAAENGHLNVLVWLRENKDDTGLTNAF